MAAVRPGEEITLDLASLQDRLPPFPGSEARALIEAEFTRPLETLFASFDENAVAAASIAQVHFARTTDGHDVAVKVLRPGIVEAFSRDLDLFLWLARLSARLQPLLRRLKPVEVVIVDDAASLGYGPDEPFAEALFYFFDQVFPAWKSIFARQHQLRITV